jgi:hypothetical protein
MIACAYRPHMKIMHVDNARRLQHGRSQLRQIDMRRRAFQQNLRRLAHDMHGAENHKRGNEQRKRRINPCDAARKDDDSA